MIKKLKKQWPLQVMVLPGVIFMIVFSYIPMYGIMIAFQKFTMIDTMSTAPWVGLENFRIAFSDRFFWNSIVNTLGISLLHLTIGFVSPIILALMIYELKEGPFKKTVQTISYLPHFMSWIIFGGMVISWLANDGLVTNFFVSVGLIKEPVNLLLIPDNYWFIAAMSDIWKEVGWGTILYLAAMSGIDPTFYEAARIDGASKLKQIWYITFPSIRGIIALMFVMSVGGLFGSNFDQALVLQNRLTLSKSEVISSYVFKMGVTQGDFSYGTAVGLAISIISLVLLLITNQLTKKLNDRSIF